MNKYWDWIIGFIAVVALVVGFSAMRQNTVVSVADKVIDRGEIRIGYIVYPPLLSKDEATGKLSGISYELVEAAAAKLNLKTNWVEEVGWGSALEGLKTKRYDILGTQMWPNSARAREAVFADSPFSSGIYPYVRAGDNRFGANLAQFNSPNITISVVDGELSQFIAKENLPQAKVNALPQLASYAESFLNVVNHKADVVFAEPSSANDFLKTNPGSIQRIGEKPIRMYGLSFAFARGQESMVSMWNVAIDELVKEDVVSTILEKYNASQDYIINK